MMSGQTMNKRSYPQYAAMYFFYFFGMASYVSILSIYLRGIGKSASDVSLIVSASGIFTIASQPFIGAMFDQTRNRRLLCAKLLGFSCLAAVLFSLTGTVLFLGTLTEIPLILSSNRFMDRFSGKFLLSANFLLLAVEFAVYSFCPLTAGVCLVVFLCKSTATMLFIMVTLKVVLSLVSEDVSATALSVVNTAKQVGTIVLTWISGFIADRFALSAVFYGLLAAACIGLLLSAFLRPPVKKQELFR